MRVLGGVLVFLGGTLLAGMAVFAFLMFGVIQNSDNPGSTTRFTGSESAMMFIFGILALVFFFGLVAFAAGSWQLIFGRRNLILVLRDPPCNSSTKTF